MNQEDYQLIDSLGEGAYGKVYSVRHNQTNEEYAMKKIPLKNYTEGIPQHVLREVSALKSLGDHLNIVK